MENEHDDGTPRDPRESEFNQMLSSAARDVREGTITADVFLRLAGSRDEYAVRYGLRRMADPDLKLWEERLLQRVFLQSAIVLQFIAGLARKAPDSAEPLARTFREAAAHPALRIRSEDVPLVMRALAVVQEMTQSAGAVAFLFALLNADAPRIQSRVAWLIQKTDSELRYTRRLLRHRIPRVRANTLEALLGFKDPRTLEHFRSCAADTYSRVRSLAGVGLCRSGDASGWEILMRLVRHPLIPERRSGVWALGMCGNREHLSLLESLARSDPDERLRELAVGAAERIRGTQSRFQKEG